MQISGIQHLLLTAGGNSVPHTINDDVWVHPQWFGVTQAVAKHRWIARFVDCYPQDLLLKLWVVIGLTKGECEASEGSLGFLGQQILRVKNI